MIGTVTFDGLSQGQLWMDLPTGVVDALDGLGIGALNAPKDRRDARAAARRLLSSRASTGSASRARARSAAASASRKLEYGFVHSLVPIAAVYVAAHYLTFLIFEGQAITYLACDPFGQGWDLFGTVDAGIDYTVFPQEDTWYVQVAVVVIGHVAALALAHDRALTLYGDAKLAVRSQYWMLGVMVGFTSLALWLLAQAGLKQDALPARPRQASRQDARQASLPHHARHDSLPPRRPRRRRSSCWPARAGRLRRLDRLHQGQATSGSTTPDGVAPVPGDDHRRLRGRLPGRRRHDVALNGVRLHHLARDGARARRLRHARLRHAPGRRQAFWGPYDPAISPDGTKVAYTYYWLSQTTTPDCFPPDCLVALNEGGTGYTWSDRHDRLEDRRRDRLPLRLAPPVVGRQRHDDDLQPDPPPEPRPAPRPHLRRRQRPRQHGHELVQRRGRATRT